MSLFQSRDSRENLECQCKFRGGEMEPCDKVPDITFNDLVRIVAQLANEVKELKRKLYG